MRCVYGVLQLWGHYPQMPEYFTHRLAHCDEIAKILTLSWLAASTWIVITVISLRYMGKMSNFIGSWIASMGAAELMGEINRFSCFCYATETIKRQIGAGVIEGNAWRNRLGRSSRSKDQGCTSGNSYALWGLDFTELYLQVYLPSKTPYGLYLLIDSECWIAKSRYLNNLWSVFGKKNTYATRADRIIWFNVVKIFVTITYYTERFSLTENFVASL